MIKTPLNAIGYVVVLSAGLLLFCSGRAAAQDSLSTRDASEIRYKAERIVGTELNELLNALSSTAYETREVAESITASYSVSRNRIFRDSLVLVEPDVNPAIRTSAQSGDEPVEKYLKDIDLIYKKSDSPTIEFSNIRCSPVKKKEHLYVKVYFNSRFKGRSVVNDQDYAIVSRIAELKAEKDDNQWHLYIDRLAFFDPADTAGDVVNNIPIKKEAAPVIGVVEKSPDTAAVAKRPVAVETPFMVRMRTLENNRQYKEALKEYTEAIRKEPKNPDYYVGRGRCYEKMRDNARSMALALKDYTQAYDLDHNHLPAIGCRADLYARMGNYFRALADYTVYLTIDKSDITIYEKKSQMHVLLKMPADAIADLDEALRIDSSNALALFYRGRCDLLLNKLPEAAKDFSRARERGLDSADRNAISGYAATYYEQAAQRFVSHGTDSAIGYIDEAIAIEPASSLYRFARGNYYYSLADYKEAIGSYDRAIEYNPSNIPALYKRGMAHFGIADNKEAIVNFEAVLKLDPHHMFAAKGEGDAYQALKDYTNAAMAYEKALRIAGSSKQGADAAVLADIYNSLGHCYFERGEYEKAVTNGRKAIGYNRNFGEAWFNRGYAYHKQGKLSEAIDDLKKATALDTKRPRWHYVLGLVYQEKKDFGNAVAQYAACTQEDAGLTLPGAIYRQGYCQYRMQHYAEALPLYSRALQVDTVQASFPMEMGIVCLNTGRYDSAYLFCQRAWRQDSTNGYTAYCIGASLYLQGKVNESMTWFGKAFRKKTPAAAIIKRDQQLAALRDDKKFKELLKKYL
ncbi:tetratricopeptide repeat protein [Puia dinghuensis]|uniref:Tetratricopeptide repeat protein n=1 Tax=Puia dinghuensis TaxID=1792502 RepID=A0A8J2XTI5_9BACT|nr:tetratricopeptide repeat protein [Puia dinghuensis]GGB03678.1 hypothetical protein GCM10011511_28710 [Puia dinghuensis]